MDSRRFLLEEQALLQAFVYSSFWLSRKCMSSRGPRAPHALSKLTGKNRSGHRSGKKGAETVSAAAVGVAVKGHGARRACHGRHTDPRSLVNETITTMDLPRISFLRREISKRPNGLDRVEFVMTMAT